jgi:hypothetical protein
VAWLPDFFHPLLARHGSQGRSMFDPRSIQTAESLSSAVGPGFVDWIHSVAFTGATWPDFRRLYKLAEGSAEPAVCTEFLLRIDAEPLTRSEAPSAATIGYFKRRGRRFLRRLARRDADVYSTISISLLSRAGLDLPSLPSHCWITWDLLFGSRVRRRATQARHGRGAYRLLSPRPTVSCPQDSLPPSLIDEEQRWRALAEDPRLPWQTRECAVIRLGLKGVAPEPSPKLSLAYLDSPSPLLHAVVADHLTTDAVSWASLPAELVAKCFFQAAGRARRLMLAGMKKQQGGDDWRAVFAATLFCYLEQDTLHPRRCVDALEAVLTSAAGDPAQLDTMRLASALGRFSPEIQAAFARVFAKCHQHVPCTHESLYPFIASAAPIVRRIGWWLTNKTLHSGVDRGDLWQKLLALDDHFVTSALADPVAVATASDSIAARAAIVDFLVAHPQHIIPILRHSSSPSHRLAVTALRHPPQELRSLLQQIWILLHGDMLREALYAILDGTSNRKHYGWVLEWMVTSHADELRGIFWEWCCEPRNEEWLREHLRKVGKLVDKESAESIASRGRVAIRLAKTGVFDLGFAWAGSVTKGLKSLAGSGEYRDLVELLAHVPDKHWSGCAAAVARRLTGDSELNDPFWAAFFAQARGGPSGLERAIASEPLRDALAAVGTPSFLECDTEQVTPLIEHWITSNPSACEGREVVMRLAVNRNAALRSHALRRLRESPCDFATALCLVETGLPDAYEVGQQNIERLWVDPNVRASMVLELVDSPSPRARDLGWDLFVRLYEAGDAIAIIPSLAESEDGQIVTRLLALLANDPSCAGALTAMRERVLLTASSTRAAKEEVKRHVAACSDSADAVFLQRVAHGAAKRDREWAIEQLVALSLGGKAIDGVDVATKGGV